MKHHGVLSATESTLELMRLRRQTSPKRLASPGPSEVQVRALFEAAAQAPDHGRILPWRFVQVGCEGRSQLGEAFACALLERDPDATQTQLQEARDKARRAPFLALAIVRLEDVHTQIPAVERYVSLGCALQNMLLAAHALGFGAGLVSGQALHSHALRELFAIESAEQAVCFIAVGTVAKAKAARQRPTPGEIVSMLACHACAGSATLGVGPGTSPELPCQLLPTSAERRCQPLLPGEDVRGSSTAPAD